MGKAIIAIHFLGFASFAIADQDIEVSQRFTGKIADPALVSARPESGIVNDLAAWKKLWTVWRPNQPIKDIDFENQIVLVETESGPVFASTLKLNDFGDLKYETASPRTDGPGFGYLIMVVPKTGIKSVNGKSLDGKPVVSQPIESNPPNGDSANQSLNQPPDSTPADRESKRPVDPLKDNSNPLGREFVNVEIVGRVRAQFQSVGAETTGTLVAADGIVWELDLQEDKQLIRAVRQLGNSLARIKGDLKMERQRGGVEAKVRWIVRVQSFEPLGLQPAIPPATLPSESPVARPLDAPPIASNSQPDPSQPNLENSVPRNTNPVQPSNSTGQTDPAVADGGAANRTSFKKVSLVTSDGQTQVINSDGSVHYESKPRNISNDWTIDPSTIAKLHQFVANTEWDRVPKKTRSDANDPNEINYTISIETPQSVTRIFIDRTAVPNEPTIKQLFDIISEMARNR